MLLLIHKTQYNTDKQKFKKIKKKKVTYFDRFGVKHISK